jgi:predicted DNA-binding ribbon-helix-helix protein
MTTGQVCRQRQGRLAKQKKQFNSISVRQPYYEKIKQLAEEDTTTIGEKIEQLYDYYINARL